MADILAASAAAIAQVGIGHPFDTAKVFIQNNKSLRTLTPRGFYRGYRYPLFADIIYNCTAFPIYNRSQKYTNSRYLSGFLAGVSISPLVFLFDTGKILQQTGQDVSLTKIIKRNGKLATFCRESIAMTFYFSTYEYFKDQYYHPMIAGAVAGITNWTITYPIDVIRSRQIAQDITIRSAFNQGNFWKGYSLCATRALLVNAGIFYTYENVYNLVNKYID